jgi:hypothetical protein
MAAMRVRRSSLKRSSRGRPGPGGDGILPAGPGRRTRMGRIGWRSRSGLITATSTTGRRWPDCSHRRRTPEQAGGGQFGEMLELGQGPPRYHAGRARSQALVRPGLPRADVQHRGHPKQVPQGRPEATDFYRLAGESAFLAFCELWRLR